MTKLEELYELLSDKDRWTHGAFARNEAWEEVDENSPTAVQWCLLGAKYKLNLTYKEAIYLYDARDRLYGSHIILTYLNDGLGYEAVMNVIREAIKLEKENNANVA